MKFTIFDNEMNNPQSKYESVDSDQASKEEEVPISKAELRALLKSSFLAAFAVGSIMIIVFFLFILFCVTVWF